MSAIQPSSSRVLTTHAGSLPRPADVRAVLMRGGDRSDDAIRQRMREAVAEAVGRQVDSGIDVVSDGETGKVGFILYVADRLAGVSLERTVDGVYSRHGPADLRDYPEALGFAFAGTAISGEQEAGIREETTMLVNDGPITYTGAAQLAEGLDSLRAALEGRDVEDAFLPAISPSIAAMQMVRRHYESHAELLEALGEALAHEYRAVVDAGFILQVDTPDITGKHVLGFDMSLQAYREQVAVQIDVLNRALRGIDPSRVRIHLCWGNYPGPHHHDLPLRDVIDLAYRVNAAGISVEAANPRHEHEWTVFEEAPLPEGKYVIPGVIDVCSPYIEHPEVVAQRIERYARVVGVENVVAGTDCGFGSTAGRTNVPERIVWAKLSSLAEGAKRAASRLVRSSRSGKAAP